MTRKEMILADLDKLKERIKNMDNILHYEHGTCHNPTIKVIRIDIVFTEPELKIPEPVDIVIDATWEKS